MKMVGGELGISLEGTVDVEDGVETKTHHYIRSILPEGLIGATGKLRSGDELLEVNNTVLLGMCVCCALTRSPRIVVAKHESYTPNK